MGFLGKKKIKDLHIEEAFNISNNIKPHGTLPKKGFSKKGVYKGVRRVIANVDEAYKKYEQWEAKQPKPQKRSIDDMFGGYGRIESNKNKKPGDMGYDWL